MLTINNYYFINKTEYDCYIFGNEIPAGMIYKFNNQHTIFNNIDNIITNDDVKKLISNVFTLISIDDNLVEYLKNNKITTYEGLYVNYESNLKFTDFVNNNIIKNTKQLEISNREIFLTHIKNRKNITFINSSLGHVDIDLDKMNNKVEDNYVSTRDI